MVEEMMADIRVTILARFSLALDKLEIVRVFDSVEACEQYIVGIVRANRTEELQGLAMTSHLVYGGAHGNAKLYTRKDDSTLSSFADVSTTRE